MKSSFWNDAAKYGAFLGLAAIAVDIASFYTQSILLSMGWLALYVTLVYLFTRRRAQSYPSAEAFGYGARLGFIVAMMLFAGFLEGVFTALAANSLFVEQYDATLRPAIEMIENSGFYTRDMIDRMLRLLHSPMLLIVSGMLGSALKGAFFGLFIAAFAKPDDNPFHRDTCSDE